MNELVAAVDGLVSSLPGETSGELLMDVVTELETQIRRLQGLQLACLERVDRSGAAAAQHVTTTAWLRHQHRLSSTDAHRRVHLARDLADAMPRMHDALLSGAIGMEHAQAGSRLRKVAGDDQMRNADPALTDAARRMDPVELRGWVTAAIHSITPERIAEDEATAYDERELHMATTFRGIGVGNWTLDPVSQERVMTAIHAASAPRSGGDERTASQRRADGLIDVCDFYNKYAARIGEVATHGGEPPQLTVIVPWETLAKSPGATTAATGYGQQVSGKAARRLACESKVVRIITGPAGEILDAGRASRTFTAAARRAVVARDRHCIWEGCNVPAAWCEVHHGIHWADGGPSNVDNGNLICGRHHDLVHHRGHPIRIHRDGKRTVDPDYDPWRRRIIDERIKPEYCRRCDQQAEPT